MGHGGYGNKGRGGGAAVRKKPAADGQRRRTKPVGGVDKNKKSAKKPKIVSIKNQIRSTERMLRKDLPPEIKEVQQNKLEDLKKQHDTQNRLAVERQIFLRNRKIKFFERRKIERRLRRLEKQQRASTDQAQEADIADQLSKLKEDLEYVRFFPKTEKYVPLFIGGDEAEIMGKRNNLREKIKANLVSAAASGKDLEETGSEDDGLLDASDDDFFVDGSSSDDNADDEWSARDQASSASGKAASGMSSDERNQASKFSGKTASGISSERNQDRKFLGKAASGMSSDERNQASKFSGKAASGISSDERNHVSKFSGKAASGISSDERNQKQISARALMPPPGPSGKPPFSNPLRNKSRFAGASSSGNINNNSYNTGEISTSSNTSSISFRKRGPVDSTTGHSGNLSSNSDARKPRRKRRPKKKKQ